MEGVVIGFGAGRDWEMAGSGKVKPWGVWQLRLACFWDLRQHPDVKNLVLFGFMGSGKSSVGRLAAAELSLQFVDMDRLIEEREHRSISEIFRREGEVHFRNLEKHLVQELSAQRGLVVATGGGVILDRSNVDQLIHTGVVIGLRVDADTAFARTKGHGHRPLLQVENPQDRIVEVLRDRGPLYEALPHVVESSGRPAADVAADVVAIYLDEIAGPH